MNAADSGIILGSDEIQLDFIRAAGPGGQNVNKVASGVQLRFNVHKSPSLSPEIKERLIKLAGSRITDDGVLIIEAKRYRTQEANRTDALNRLAALIGKAAMPPKPRKATRPSGASRARRLKEKRVKSALKQLRRQNPDDWE